MPPIHLHLTFSPSPSPWPSAVPFQHHSWLRRRQGSKKWGEGGAARRETEIASGTCLTVAPRRQRGNEQNKMRDPFPKRLMREGSLVLSCKFGLKTPRHARTHAQSKPNCAYCYFYIAAHPRSTLNCSCVAQVPGSSDSVGAPQTPSSDPPGPQLPRSFPCVGRIGTESFPAQGGVGPHSLPRAEPTHRLRLVILGHGALRVLSPLLHCLFLRVDSCLGS